MMDERVRNAARSNTTVPLAFSESAEAVARSRHPFSAEEFPVELLV
jgi:hypothetical protein